MARPVSSSAFFWEAARRNLRSWLLGLFVSIFMLALIAYTIIKPQIDLRDVSGTSLQHGTGVVSFISPGIADNSGRVSPDQVSVKLDRDAQIQYFYTSQTPLQRGEQVQVTYRTGKSGQIYVIAAEPIREGDYSPCLKAGASTGTMP